MPAGPGVPLPATIRKLVEFYTIELAPLADGGIYVSMTATCVDDEEPQLLTQEIVQDRVATITDALSLIKSGLINAGERP